MRHATIAGIFTVILMLVPSLVFAEHVIDDSENPGYLFVLSATSGSLKGDTLTLNGVPNVIYFSDRPARKVGHISVSEFIEMWDKGVDSFKADPPNATLSILGKVDEMNVVVELMSVKQKRGSVIFKVEVLLTNGTLVRTGRIFEESATLFIDAGAGISCKSLSH